MYSFNYDDNIRCSFNLPYNDISEESKEIIEAFFAVTNEISCLYSDFRSLIDKCDEIKAEELHSTNGKITNTICHLLLRMIISEKLNKDPSEIIFEKNKLNKPYLKEDNLYFNISHNHDAFAFVISNSFRVGVDIEKTDRNINFKSIIRTFFSKDEHDYIMELPDESVNRFLLLWTRKEALLKAIGTGIISDLSQVEVLRQENTINNEIFNNFIDDIAFSDYFIYSRKFLNYYLSIATPKKTKIVLHHLHRENLSHYLQEYQISKNY